MNHLITIAALAIPAIAIAFFIQAVCTNRRRHRQRTEEKRRLFSQLNPPRNGDPDR